MVLALCDGRQCIGKAEFHLERARPLDLLYWRGLQCSSPSTMRFRFWQLVPCTWCSMHDPITTSSCPRWWSSMAIGAPLPRPRTITCQWALNFNLLRDRINPKWRCTTLNCSIGFGNCCGWCAHVPNRENRPQTSGVSSLRYRQSQVRLVLYQPTVDASVMISVWLRGRAQGMRTKYTSDDRYAHRW